MKTLPYGLPRCRLCWLAADQRRVCLGCAALAARFPNLYRFLQALLALHCRDCENRRLGVCKPPGDEEP